MDGCHGNCINSNQELGLKDRERTGSVRSKINHDKITLRGAERPPQNKLNLVVYEGVQKISLAVLSN